MSVHTHDVLGWWTGLLVVRAVPVTLPDSGALHMDTPNLLIFSCLNLTFSTPVADVVVPGLEGGHELITAFFDHSHQVCSIIVISIFGM